VTQNLTRNLCVLHQVQALDLASSSSSLMQCQIQAMTINKRVCVVPKLRGLKLLALNPNPVKRLHLAKGWGRGQTFYYLTTHARQQSMR
jgi:hypothetical protein